MRFSESVFVPRREREGKISATIIGNNIQRFAEQRSLRFVFDGNGSEKKKERKRENYSKKSLR